MQIYCKSKIHSPECIDIISLWGPERVSLKWGTPTFPPDSCYLSGAPCQTITGHLSTPTRHLSDKYHTWTICPPDIYCAICTPDVHQTYTRHPPHICQIYGICLVYMWYLSDILQSSDNHLTGSTRQIATLWRKRWCIRQIRSPNIKWKSDYTIACYYQYYI